MFLSTYLFTQLGGKFFFQLGLKETCMSHVSFVYIWYTPHLLFSLVYEVVTAPVWHVTLVTYTTNMQKLHHCTCSCHNQAFAIA